jgi:hypothetical protein
MQETQLAGQCHSGKLLLRGSLCRMALVVSIMTVLQEMLDIKYFALRWRLCASGLMIHFSVVQSPQAGAA